MGDTQTLGDGNRTQLERPAGPPPRGVLVSAVTRRSGRLRRVNAPSGFTAEKSQTQSITGNASLLCRGRR